MSNAIPLSFTDNAAKKVGQLITEEGNPALNLRVFISGGGCSGFQYGFTFDEAINADDMVIEKKLMPLKNKDAENEDDQGGSSSSSSSSSSSTTATAFSVVKLLVDPMSFQYLVGAEIDYREDTNGAQFVIRNPNAKTTCGCGSSFSA